MADLLRHQVAEDMKDILTGCTQFMLAIVGLSMMVLAALMGLTVRIVGKMTGTKT